MWTVGNIFLIFKVYYFSNSVSFWGEKDEQRFVP